jgi:hypothetical protein
VGTPQRYVLPHHAKGQRQGDVLGSPVEENLDFELHPA